MANESVDRALQGLAEPLQVAEERAAATYNQVRRALPSHLGDPILAHLEDVTSALRDARIAHNQAQVLERKQRR